MNRKTIFNKVFTTIQKIANLNLEALHISDYNKKYLKDYISNKNLYASLYTDLIYKAVQKLQKPIQESVFIDYGGGCGLLSYCASSLGFKEIIYNDIYEISVIDTKLITKALCCKIDFFVCGDIEELLSEINKNNIVLDVICSFDVLEHIYDIQDWFHKLKQIKTPFSLCFMTSANGANPYVKRRLQKIHYQAEYIGKQKLYGWKERDANSAFLEIRKKIINEFTNELDNKKVEILAKATRGLQKKDIEKVISDYLKTGKINNKLPYLTNTCDPYTGNWAENILDLHEFKKMLEDKKTVVKFTNSKYGYTQNKLLNIVKFILNIILTFLGKESLFLSHTYTLEVEFNK